MNELAAEGKKSYFPIKYAYLRQKYNATHRPWRDSDIRFIIKNDLYIGRMQYAVNSKSPYLRGLDPINTFRQDLRIISDEVSERNQKLVGLRKQLHSHTQNSRHLFSGILRCPYCDSVMSGKRQVRQQKTKTTERFSYSCSLYQQSGPQACKGFWVNEREVVNAVLPVLTELVQKNLREHLRAASETDPLHLQLEGELKAELTKVNTSMKNLLEAVKQGALSFEQVKEENAELQAAKQRLEKRLNDLKDSNRIGEELSAVLHVFDTDLETVISDLMQNRLRFNTFIRLFFSTIVIGIDRPGLGWRKGKKKGELPECNSCIQKFALEEKSAVFVDQSKLTLPDGLKNAERYSWNLWDNHGSPCDYTRTDLGLQFVDLLRTLFHRQSVHN